MACITHFTLHQMLMNKKLLLMTLITYISISILLFWNIEHHNFSLFNNTSEFFFRQVPGILLLIIGNQHFWFRKDKRCLIKINALSVVLTYIYSLINKYSGFGSQRTAIIPPFKFLKWLVHYMATLLLMISAMTVVL